MRVVLFAVTLLVGLALFAGSSFAQSTRPSSKKLIEFGWDEPDTAYLRKHIAEMEKTPFDGTVFHLTQDFLWKSWSTRTFTEAELRPAINDLQNTPLKRFTHNFLRFNVAPGDVDWFDDFSPILANAKLVAKVAKKGKCAGLLFDIEQYNEHPFEYAKARNAKTKSFEQYAAQARARGREVMNAFQGEFPDLVVFLTFGYSLPHAQAGVDKAKLAQVDYGLLKSFLDGMFDAAAGKSTIVDGFEISYGYKTAQQFSDAATTVKKTILPWVADRQKYVKHGALGFGLWIDYDWRKYGWDEKDISKNYFTPNQFEASVKHALATADEYVWIYTEKPRWWDPQTGKPTALPWEYDKALRRATGRE
jgi:hypothetical protein